MARLKWGALEDIRYETGVDRCVVYPLEGVGFPWSGVLSVKESDGGASQQLTYIDGVGYQNELVLGTFSGSIEAITYPTQLEIFEGLDRRFTAQGKRPFNFSYRTLLQDGHYRIHLVTNAMIAPTEANRTSVADTEDISTFTWALSTIPVTVPGMRASSHFYVDTNHANPGLIEDLEAYLYGDEDSQAGFPDLEQLLAIFDENVSFKVTDLGNGVVMFDSPDARVRDVETNLWELSEVTVVQVSEDTFEISSW